MEKVAFCEQCGSDTEFEVRDELVTVDLKGMKFTYRALVPTCTKCGGEVSVPEINDLNIIRAYQAQKDILEKGK